MVRTANSWCSTPSFGSNLANVVQFSQRVLVPHTYEVCASSACESRFLLSQSVIENPIQSGRVYSSECERQVVMVRLRRVKSACLERHTKQSLGNGQVASGFVVLRLPFAWLEQRLSKALQYL